MIFSTSQCIDVLLNFLGPFYFSKVQDRPETVISHCLSNFLFLFSIWGGFAKKAFSQVNRALQRCFISAPALPLNCKLRRTEIESLSLPLPTNLSGETHFFFGNSILPDCASSLRLESLWSVAGSKAAIYLWEREVFSNSILHIICKKSLQPTPFYAIFVLMSFVQQSESAEGVCLLEKLEKLRKGKGLKGGLDEWRERLGR